MKYFPGSCPGLNLLGGTHIHRTICAILQVIKEYLRASPNPEAILVASSQAWVKIKHSLQGFQKCLANCHCFGIFEIQQIDLIQEIHKINICTYQCWTKFNEINTSNRYLESAFICVKKIVQRWFLWSVWSKQRFTGCLVMWHSTHKITYLFLHILPWILYHWTCIKNIYSPVCNLCKYKFNETGFRAIYVEMNKLFCE